MTAGNLKRRHLHRDAERLAHVVGTLIPPIPTDPLVTVSAGWQQLESLGVEDILDLLDVSRARASTHGQWEFGGAGLMSTDLHHLLSVIRDKEADLTRYRTGFDECWLIVYSLPQPSAFFDFGVLKHNMFQSTFDGVAFVDILVGRVVLVA